MAKVVKEDLKRIYILTILLNGNKWKKQQIINEVNRLVCALKEVHEEVHELKDHNEYKYYKKSISTKDGGIVDGMISTTLKELHENNLIEEEVVKEERRGPATDQYWIIKDPLRLFMVFKEFYNDNLNSNLRSSLGSLLIGSPFAKKIITMDLINFFEFNTKLTFEEEEKNLILNIFKISPSSLFYAFNEINGIRNAIIEEENDYGLEGKLTIKNDIKKAFLFQLQIRLGIDMGNMSQDENFSGKYGLQYEITTTFKDPLEISNEISTSKSIISQFIEKDKIKTINRSVGYYEWYDGESYKTDELIDAFYFKGDLENDKDDSYKKYSPTIK
ncbi:MAG: hypothetical protein NKF70_06805 [Methanobacterium sp. ERen5]|nr:MAG: hypothetical protein NKF70_06805 [Methanobacterium sp. ERen5]